MSRRCIAGFTLMELLTVLAVIGIIAVIALPMYRDHALRGHLARATEGLADMRGRMEKHYQNRRTYATDGGVVSPCAVAAAQRTFGVFVVDCQTLGAEAFLLRATGSGAAAGFILTLDQRDGRATTGVPAGSGWTTCTTRWMRRKGDTC